MLIKDVKLHVKTDVISIQTYLGFFGSILSEIFCLVTAFAFIFRCFLKVNLSTK